MTSSTTDLPTTPSSPLPWHHRTADDTLGELHSQTAGLDAAEAARRLERWGPNTLPSQARRGPVIRMLGQFHNLLIYFLLVAVVVTWLLDHRVDSVAILAVVVVNAIVGFIQEGRAERALDTLMAMISPEASVIREGRRRSLPVGELVPGDIAVIAAGDRVPADVRLLTATALLIEEAALTGESVAAEKHPDPVAEHAPLAERSSMAYSGTLVVAGQGTGVVVATGAATEIGRIGTMIGGVQSLVTPLLRQINGFARTITWVALAGGLALFLVAYGLRGYTWIDALVAVVALAVSLVPEGLPAVITITLSIGVQRMAGRQAIIRRLAAVETLGATSVICSDKTGTLTRNEMTVRRLVTPVGTVLFGGAGYAPEGERSPIPGAGPRRRRGSF